MKVRQGAHMNHHAVTDLESAHRSAATTSITTPITASTTAPATPVTPVATAVLGERRRLLQLFEAVYRTDGTIDPQRLAEFEDVLRAGAEGITSPHARRQWVGNERRNGERRAH